MLYNTISKFQYLRAFILLLSISFDTYDSGNWEWPAEEKAVLLTDAAEGVQSLRDDHSLILKQREYRGCYDESKILNVVESWPPTHSLSDQQWSRITRVPAFPD